MKYLYDENISKAIYAHLLEASFYTANLIWNRLRFKSEDFPKPFSSAVLLVDSIHEYYTKVYYARLI